MGIEGVIYSNVTVDEGRRGGGSGRGRVLAGYWPGSFPDPFSCMYLQPIVIE
jgi:hypothetical protein